MSEVSMIAAGSAAEEQRFLYKVYADSRREEMESWGWNKEQRAWFLQMQYEFRRRSYEMRYEKPEVYVIGANGQRAGQVTTAAQDGMLWIVDIAVLSPFRNHGIGTRVIRDLQTQAARQRLRVGLHVRLDNPAARRLYERLRFRVESASELDVVMEWSDTAGSASLNHEGRIENG
ncbi:GNAT family N-acetyltransferase [Saccharibacillus sp. CPCC 101409]|uniref:GNAT family N-acetyltransferase n=1 Tax=Saccharibacillus sp. CPCC 101409 TaxID=3058041 RepID=UPI002671F80F|nr:GNAT family N-acetyltransferase [Saccharibacillus sp. CPCC 101409]MDO3410554.1 GNAT family N-acetyltransferase [Saccharibacillus sp. CPCC 101409]